ncbi:MAG: MetQ/NlpA family ABC transporter substrate-binding protein [Erysipelotrichaceae bacterium]
MKKGLLALLLVGLVSGCGNSSNEDTIIRIGASPVPHAEILEQVKPLVEAKGYTLKIQEFTDYVLPNTALESGDLDANYFQHVPYLEDFNIKNKTNIVSVLSVHFEPLTLYSSKANKGIGLDQIKTGAKIAVPNDETNEARALQLLEANGLITLKAGVGLQATPLDIVENPYNIEIVEIDAAQLVRILEDVDYAVINGNNALMGDIGELAVASEDKASQAAQTFGNILAVRAGEEHSEKTKVLIEALSDASVSTYIREQYNGFVLPLQ